MTIALKANAAGTQGEIQLNGNPVAEFLANAVNFPGLAQSFTPNGYAKLPGGLIIQWGVVAGGAAGALTVTFPIPFPTTLLSVIATLEANPSSANTVTVFSTTPSQVSFNRKYVASGGTVGDAIDAVRWIALGY